MRTLVSPFLLGAIAATLSAPAYATNHAPAAEVSHQVEVRISPDGETEYCVRMRPTTGSILPREICKTAAEWEKEGARIVRK